MSQISNWIEIFKPGRHVSSSGQAIDFSENQVKATALAYNSDVHSAPLVVGHPAMDDPAYGWTKSLAFSNGKLTALPEDVDPAFAELVNARRYGKISASFYPPNSQANPVPGVYYLRHIGFLGAQPPAVKGLKCPSFSDNGNAMDIVSFDFGEVLKAPMDNQSIATRARDYKAKMDSLGFNISFSEAIDAITNGEDRVEFGEQSSKNLSDSSIARLARAYKAEMDAKGGNMSFTEAVDAVTGGRSNIL